MVRRDVVAARADRRSLLLAVAATYYLGARVGFVLRFPPATTSLIWPPNALLTAVLLLTPPGRWWLCILAAFPAHLVVVLEAGFSLPFVLAIFATNCLEALLAAGAVYWLSDDPTRFDTLHRVIVFVGGAVFLAPFVSSFPDAAAVSFFQGEPFWIVFVRRFFSNSLSQLTLVPSAVVVVRQGLPLAAPLPSAGGASRRSSSLSASSCCARSSSAATSAIRPTFPAAPTPRCLS